MALPSFTPMPLVRVAQPFDHEDWLFEIKWDGFRALAYIERDEAKLVSRTGHVYKTFPQLREWLGKNLGCRNAILDGEIVCLDAAGNPQFNRLLCRRGIAHFYAFDLLWLDGKDLRKRPLLARKERLKALVPGQPSLMLYSDHIEGTGTQLFQLACERDLEGIVAKRKDGEYLDGGRTSWLKIKNPNYSQAIGRQDQFAERRGRTARFATPQLAVALP